MLTFLHRTKPPHKTISKGSRSWKPSLEVLEDRTLLTAIVDLGVLEGHTNSIAWGINNFGQVVGTSYEHALFFGGRAFLYGSGTMTDLGTLGGTSSYGSSINNSGQVAGGSETVGGQRHAFRYSGGVMTDLGTLGGHSFGIGINDAGQVVGDSELFIGGRSRGHAFLSSGGAMTDLGILGTDGSSTAYGINNAGQVVGASETGDRDNYHAFVYSGGTMIDLGTLGRSSHGYGINDHGQVVGVWESASDVSHAFLYSGGTMTDLGTLGGAHSEARGINNAGQVVGESWTLTTVEHAFLYSGGRMIDLNDLLPADSGWELVSAFDINDAGQIVGFGFHEGQNRAFLLTLSDVVATSLTSNAVTGRVDFQYTVSGSQLARDTTAQLYWATGTTTDTILEPATTPITIPRTTPLDTAVTLHVGADDFPGGAPAGARYLIAIVDPDNLIDESDETNNLESLGLTAPTVTFLNVDNPTIGQAYEIVVQITNNSPIYRTFTLRANEYHPPLLPPPLDQPIAATDPQVVTLGPFEQREISLGTFAHSWEWIDPINPVVPVLETLNEMTESITTAFAAGRFDLLLEGLGGFLGRLYSMFDLAGDWVTGLSAQRSDTYWYTLEVDGVRVPGEFFEVTITVPLEYQAYHLAYLAASSAARLSIDAAIGALILQQYELAIGLLGSAYFEFELARAAYDRAVIA